MSELILKGKFEDLSRLDQMYYNKCIDLCNHCNGICRQDVKYQQPEIIIGTSGRTELYFKYCYKRNYGGNVNE